MLLVVDMQNSFLSSDYETTYVSGAEKLIPGILERISYYKEQKAPIYYTIDVPLTKKLKNGIEERPINSEANNENRSKKLKDKTEHGTQLVGPLSEVVTTKHKLLKSYYGIPPTTLVRLQGNFEENLTKIELVGIETHLCVLSNAVMLQSAFPNAEICINESLCKSKIEKNHQLAIKIMKIMGMKIEKN